MPPDLGIAVPNSNMTKIPQVEMMAPMTQHIKAIPTLPDSLKMVLGVEKILQWSAYKSNTSVKRLKGLPCTNNLVHDQRDGPEQTDRPLLQDVDLDNAQLAIFD